MTNNINQIDKNKFEVNKPNPIIDNAKTVAKAITLAPATMTNEVMDFDLDDFVENASNVIGDVGENIGGALETAGNAIGDTFNAMKEGISEIFNFDDQVEDENKDPFTYKDGKKEYEVHDNEGNVIKTISTEGDIEKDENGNIIVTEKSKYSDAISKQIIYDPNGNVKSETEYNTKNGRIDKKTEILDDGTTRITTDAHSEKFGLNNYGYHEEIRKGDKVLSEIQYDYDGNPMSTSEHSYTPEGTHIVKNYDNESNLTSENEFGDGYKAQRKFDNNQITYEEKKFDNGGYERKEYDSNGKIMTDEKVWIENDREYGISYHPYIDENGEEILFPMYKTSNGGWGGSGTLSDEEKAYYGI